MASGCGVRPRLCLDLRRCRVADGRGVGVGGGGIEDGAGVRRWVVVRVRRVGAGVRVDDRDIGSEPNDCDEGRVVDLDAV